MCASLIRRDRPLDMGLQFTVEGVPVAQGSKRGMLHRSTGKVVLFDDNAKALRPWRAAIVKAAQEAMGQQPRPYFPGDVAVRVTFRFVRPPSSKRKYPGVAPDTDKLIRACGDALTDAKVWVDDARVIQWNASKVYAATPGLVVDIRPVY